jgi:metal-responsive CopG/Arc/MetJ family transcriptional regulator
MPLIKPKPKVEKIRVSIKIDSLLLSQIEDYCKYAGFSKPDDFFSEAAHYVISKDKDYADHVKAQEVVA